MKPIIVFVLTLVCSFAHASSPWLEAQSPNAIRMILENSKAPGAVPGAIIASPSTKNPNYFYFWVRDGALTMMPIVTMWQRARDPKMRSFYGKLINDYVQFSRSNQTARTLTGLGEPKFHVDGRGFTGNWGRPQNDGPALRSITLIRVAEDLLAKKIPQGPGYIAKYLYDTRSPSRTIIKTDLDYLAANWQKPCFDLWEEAKGVHFYTLMVQRKAFIWGASLATKLGDVRSAQLYSRQAQAITAFLPKFWDASRNQIIPTLNQTTGTKKPAALDIAVVLGALHGGLGDGYFDAYDARVETTLKKIEAAFKDAYAINQRADVPPAIGRYPEDLYDGTNLRGSIGNAWVLTTLAAAEFHYLRGDTARGDAYADRISLHVGATNSLAEQIDRNTGRMMSARDLTWSYASVLTTLEAAASKRYTPVH